jgi:hypothetical protein
LSTNSVHFMNGVAADAVHHRLDLRAMAGVTIV